MRTQYRPAKWLLVILVTVWPAPVMFLSPAVIGSEARPAMNLEVLRVRPVRQLPDGMVGLITFGKTAAKFDGLQVLDLMSNRPLSQPAAY